MQGVEVREGFRLVADRAEGDFRVFDFEAGGVGEAGSCLGAPAFGGGGECHAVEDYVFEFVGETGIGTFFKGYGGEEEFEGEGLCASGWGGGGAG